MKTLKVWFYSHHSPRSTPTIAATNATHAIPRHTGIFGNTSIFGLCVQCSWNTEGIVGHTACVRQQVNFQLRTLHKQYHGAYSETYFPVDLSLQRWRRKICSEWANRKFQVTRNCSKRAGTRPSRHDLQYFWFAQMAGFLQERVPPLSFNRSPLMALPT